MLLKKARTGDIGPYAGLALTSAATLLYELALTRFFALAEWYHFGFLSVNVALLGYAASGTLLSLLPRSPHGDWVARIATLGMPISFLGSYLLINRIPFDSYRLAWERQQFLYLAGYYLALVPPFLCSGIVIAYWLAREPQRSHALYGANLIGSAAGTFSLLGALPLLGIEGATLAACSLAGLGAALLLARLGTREHCGRRAVVWLAALMALVCAWLAWRPPTWSSVRLSPYKSLSYALLRADARLGYRAWSLAGRVDVVESEQIHAAPGLSLHYRGRLPPQHGLTLDGDNLSPITRRQEAQDREFLAYMPASIPYRMRPTASALILQPRGGLDVAIALEMGARAVTVVDEPQAIVTAVRDVYAEWTGQLYRDPRVSLQISDARNALERLEQRFDIVQLSLAETYRPLLSGAYSLSESHLYTVEAMDSALRRLAPGGLLVVTRWLQDPPSECLRAAALVVTALEQQGIAAVDEHLLAFRSWSTLTLLASREPFSAQDVAFLREWCTRLGYDLVHHPGLTSAEANRLNVLPQPTYYEALHDLLYAADREAFYARQPYDVRPPRDDRPFYHHYFRWSQAPAIIAQLGKTWQPFAGGGFLVVLALLGFSLAAATGLIALPLMRGKPARGAGWSLRRLLCGFAALGLAYLLVEISLMQRFILYLGQPTLAFCLVLSALLLSSGMGSLLLAPSANLRVVLGVLLITVLAYPPVLTLLFQGTLHLNMTARSAIAIACLLPLGFLMGIPFAACLRRIAPGAPTLVPWIWAVNGSASVVSSVLAAILALSLGYRAVLWSAAACYALAWLAFWPLAARKRVSSSGRR